MKRRVFKIEGADAKLTLSVFLERALGLEPSTVRALLARGAVYRQGKRCVDPGAELAEGQLLTAVLEESGRGVLEPGVPLALRPRVLLEDGWVLAVDKPAGWTAQPTPGRVGESLLDWASEHLRRPAGLVHRLDRETSGVTLFGMTPEATSALAGAFREGAAAKRYLAAVPSTVPERGTVDLPLSSDPSRPGRYRATRAANGVPARTDFRCLARKGELALVELHPRTGRTHQLRAHLAALGAPIAGDTKYGGVPALEGLPAERCLLHAQAVLLPHPRSKTPLFVESPVPEDLAAFFGVAGIAAPQGPWSPLP